LDDEEAIEGKLRLQHPSEDDDYQDSEEKEDEDENEDETKTKTNEDEDEDKEIFKGEKICPKQSKQEPSSPKQ
jgi:hypothetical protein